MRSVLEWVTISFVTTRECFTLLCFSIIGAIGESQFKLQYYIDAFLSGTNAMYDANILATGGYISGEVKLAITIRLLAGEDTLDLAVIFDIYHIHVVTIIKEVLMYWIIKPNIGKTNIIKYLKNIEAMNKVRCVFSC